MKTMSMCFAIRVALAVVFGALSLCFAQAAEVSSDDALCAVRGWVNLKEALGGDFDANPESVTAYDGEDGKGRFYVVTLEGGGYVVASGDDEVTPILAYSREGTFEASEKNPLWCLLAGRAANEAERLAASASTSGGRRLAASSSATSGNAAKWSRLRAAGGADGGKLRLGKSASAPTDLRVPELLHSDWSQGRIGNYSGTDYPYCFNMYTPNHYPCGCVATAGAQLMRYFEWPKTSVTPLTFTCYSNNVPVELTMIGGTYDWANMPLNINTMYENGTSATVTTYREAIGKLTYDVGVSVGMDYDSDGSGAYTSRLPDSFKIYFGYSGAVCIDELDENDGFKKALLPNLDAKRPCGLSISSSSGGHAVVADGYGYSDGTLYVHINSGWAYAKSATAWYAPPTFDFSDSTTYTTMNSVVCNIFTNETRSSSIASGRVLDESGNPVPGAAVTAECEGSVAATATTDARGIYALVLPPNDAAKTYSVTATCPGYRNPSTISVSAAKTTGWNGFYSTNSNSYDNDITIEMIPPVYAKLVEGSFHYYTNISCSTESELQSGDAPSSVAGCIVLFANDAEYQALVPYTNELATALGGTASLQNDITLTADTDWRAMDFNLNGKSITLCGYDLKVHKPQGVGRITAGNLITNGGFENGSTGWTFGSANERVTSNGYGVSAKTCKDKPFAGNHWCVIGAPNDTAGATTHFSVARTGVCYIRFRYAKYDSNYAQYGVDCGIDTANNVVKHLDVKPYPQGNSSPIYKKTLNAGTHSFIFGRYYAYILVDEAAVSPESHLTFDIPEGEEYELSNISLGSTEDYFFDGIGLQVHKTGKGQLTMSKVNNKFGGSGVTSMVVKEGLVKKESGATCGAQYSRIVVEDGAQFDLNGRTYHDYDYTLAGSGPDGTGALISSAAMDASTAYAKNTGTSFLRHVALSSNATVYASNNMGMIFYNYKENTMTMNGHTVTYDGVEAVDGEGNGTGVGAYRTFLGNMSYSGAGKIVVAPNGWVQTHISSPTATDTDVEVYGHYWQNTGNLTPVKSLKFMEGSSFRELNASPGVIVVTGTYGPNVLTESVGSCLKHPKVQLGDASHLNATLDLSQWTTTFDDSGEGTLTFYGGTTNVTIEVGDRIAGLTDYIYLWKSKPADTVVFVPSNKMHERGLWLIWDDNGIRIKSGLSVHIR